MEVVIWCGGLGTRLREETEFRPKPMVCIGDRPILWHIMKTYAAHGHTDFVLALGYKGEFIKDYFLNYEVMSCDVTLSLGARDKLCLHNAHNEAGWRITLADTGLQSLKGSRLKRLERYISGDTFMATYGDGLANVDIDALLKFHHSHGKIATLTGVNPAARFGELKLEGNEVRSFTEKPLKSTVGLINGGYFVFNRKIFDYLSEDESCDFEYGPLEDIARAGELMVYKHPGFWACMDTIRDVEYLNRLWAEDNALWKIWDDTPVKKTCPKG
ncbi:glucose-1-phosphate cytidylyltransferase [Desulfocurvus vexinensis]|uniref:glucose-1-phosphate cytidylyltransferase n=1 Tax=Desulfocurvus vexinensis TaxID=399548 RepID=UPI00048CB4B0|nr:glucose-1-phosphate cytidylyltransferase [Desulfocurvus vexinensis]